MINNDTKGFSGEFERRLASDEWDREMAARVLSRRKRIRRMRAVTFSLTALAAAVVLAVLLPGLKSLNGDDDLYRMVEAQLSGTYGSVFTAYDSGILYSGNTLTYDEIDEFIDDTLLRR